MPLHPPLLIVPGLPLDGIRDQEQMESLVEKLSNAEYGQVLSAHMPVTLYQRVDGYWLPVTDLGAFHSPPPAQGKTDPVESRQFVPCEDGD